MEEWRNLELYFAFSGCQSGDILPTALQTCKKLTLGKMNCSTGLYHTPFIMVPVLMALKRAVTTASCKNHKPLSIKNEMNVHIYLHLNWILQYWVILKTDNPKGLWISVYNWGSKQYQQSPPAAPRPCIYQAPQKRSIQHTSCSQVDAMLPPGLAGEASP